MSVTGTGHQASKVMATMLLSFLFADGCVRDSAKSSDLTGLWVVTPASVAMLDESLSKRDMKPRLRLKADGSFLASDLPERLVTAAAEARNTLIAGSGLWRLRTFNGEQTVALTFGEINGVAIESRCYLNISSEKGKKRLYFYFDEPDAGNRFELEKEGD
jgi:hypothetical protein